MSHPQTFVAPKGVAPFLFLSDYRKYARGMIATLKLGTGDALCNTMIDTETKKDGRRKTAICRRATAADLERAAKGSAKKGAKTEPEVAVRFLRPVGKYRGPTTDKPADVATFPPAVAKRYVYGYARGNKRVGAVAEYYVDAVVDTDLEAPAELVKPRPAPKRGQKRKTAVVEAEAK